VSADCDEFLSVHSVERTVRLRLGQLLRVSFCSNPSTGHSWGEPVIADPSILAASGDSFIPPRQMIPGAPGQHAWSFRPLRAGATQVRFEYRQPWLEDADPAWSATLTVQVGG
jgi:predicted secreted protein